MNKSNFGVVTKQYCLDHLAERWLSQYPYSAKSKKDPFHDIYVKLKEAGKNLTEEMAAEIIGNSTWTQLKCDCCYEDCERLTTIDLKYRDAEWVSLCEKCLSEMFLLRESKRLKK